MLSLEKQNHWREVYRRERPGWRPATEVFAELVRRQLRPDSRVLDLGCGRGGLVEQLAADGFPPQQVTGVDPDWLSLREHRLPEVARVQSFSEPLPFAGGVFDVAFSSWLLEHLARPEMVLAEVGRVLRPGGVFVFITPNKGHPLALLNRFFGRLGRGQGEVVERVYGRAGADTFPTYYRANSAADLRGLAAPAGLALAELHVIRDPTYLAFNALSYRLALALERVIPAGRGIHLVGCLVLANQGTKLQ